MIYLGDHNPSGVHMAEDLRRKLFDFLSPRFGPNPFVFTRLAVNASQIEELNLPTRPTKRTDTRVGHFEERFGILAGPEVREFSVVLGIDLAVLDLLRRAVRYTDRVLDAGLEQGHRRLSDLRRTASKERAEAGASEAELAAGGGWSIERGSQILDVYNPRTYELAKAAQDKRRRTKRGEK